MFVSLSWSPAGLIYHLIWSISSLISLLRVAANYYWFASMWKIRSNKEMTVNFLYFHMTRNDPATRWQRIIPLPEQQHGKYCILSLQLTTVFKVTAYIFSFLITAVVSPNNNPRKGIPGKASPDSVKLNFQPFCFLLVDWRRRFADSGAFFSALEGVVLT